MQGRARDDPHNKLGDKKKVQPLIAADYGFIEGDAELPGEDDEGLPFFSALHNCSGCIGANCVRCKGADDYSKKSARSFFEVLGYLRTEVQSDGEPAIVALLQGTRAAIMKEEDNRMDVMALRRSPVHSHASNGSAEVSIKIMKGIMRTMVPYMAGM